MPVDLTELVNKKKQRSATNTAPVDSDSGGVDLTELIARKKAEASTEVDTPVEENPIEAQKPIEPIVEAIVPKEITYKPNLDFYKSSQDAIPKYSDQVKDLIVNEAIQLEDSHKKIIEAEKNIQNIVAITGRTPEEVKDLVNFDEFTKSLTPRKVSPQESYATAPIRGLYESVGNTLNTIGGAIDKFSESLGFDPPSNGIISQTGKWYKDMAGTLQATPDNALGDAAQNIGAIAGTILMSELVAPAIATPGLTIGGATIARQVPKFPLFLGAEKGTQAYVESDDPLAPVKKFGEGYVEGLKYTMLGVPARAVGNLVEKATLEPVIGEASAAVASGLLFGTDATATEYAETGKINSRTFLANFGIGVGFHTGQIKTKILEGMQQKAVSSFFNATPEQIKQSIESPLSKEDIRRRAIELRQAAFKTDGQERNQYLLAANMADKTADIKAISDDVLLDKEKYIEGINRDNSLTPERKEEVIGLVNKVSEYKQAKVDEYDRLQKESAKKAEEDRKLAEDQLKAEKDKQLESTETPEAKTKINDKFKADTEALAVKKTEDIDSDILDAQKRLNMPNEPEVRIDVNTDITLGKIENNEPVTNDFIKSASDNLYQEYKGLEVMKSSDLRKFTIEQIEKKQEELGKQITQLENYQAKQKEESKFITDKAEVKTEEVIQEAPEIPIKEEILTPNTQENAQETKTTQEPTQTEPAITEEAGQKAGEEKVKPTIESRANALADAIQDKRFYKTMDEMMNLKSDFGGVELLKNAWDGSLNIAAEVVRAGGKVAQAISDSIEYLKGTDWYKGLSDTSKKIAEQKLREEIKSRTEEARQVRAEAKSRIRQEKLDTKKTRMKLPSESPVKKVTLSEMAGLKDQLRLEVKAAVESARSVKKSFKELGAEIKGKFKGALDKGFITGGQYRSIINRLSTATTERTQKGLLEYVDKVLDEATYTKELQKAKSVIEDIKKSNKKGKSEFGDWRVVADAIGRIRAKDMTVEELADFNKIASEVLAGETVNIPALNELYVSYSRFEQNVIKITKAKTVADIWKSIEKIEEMASSTTTMAGYMQMKHAVENARVRVGELFDAGEISQKEMDAFRELVEGKDSGVEGVSKGFEDQLKDIKERILARIDSERRPSVVDIKIIDNFKEGTRNLIYSILGAKRADIALLDAKDIDSYLQFVRNLKEGAFVPESASLGIKLDMAKIRRTATDQAAANYSKSKRFAEAVRLRFTNPLHKKLQERSILKSLSSKSNTEEFNLVRTLRSFSTASMESYLGNMDATKNYSATMALIGKAFNQSNAFRKPMEDRAVKMINNFLKFKGTSKQKREEKMTFGMFMAERRFQANRQEGQAESSFFDLVYREKSGDIRPKMDDQTAFDRNKNIYEKMFAKAKAVGATKIAEGREIIDIDKFEVELRKDKRWDKMISETDQWFADMEDKVEVSTMMNGRTYIKEKNYFPLIQQGASSFMDTESMRNLVDFNSTGIKMQAGATFAANKVKQQIELDPTTIFHSHLAEITRNYFIFPKLKAAVDAIKASSLAQAEINLKESKESGKEPYDNHAAMLGRAFAKALVSRTAFNLNGRRQTEYSQSGRWLDKMLSAKKKALLANPIRVAPELMSNMLRGMISSSILSAKYDMNKDVYQGMIDDMIGEKHFSKMAEDVSEVKFSGKASVFLEKGAIGVITFADTQVGRRLYATEMNVKFEQLTGESFDPGAYKNDSEYREKYKEELEQANLWALRRTEELFNSKNVMSTPELARFIGGFFKSDAGKFGTKLFDMLQGFNRNEFEHMMRSARRMKYGDQYDRTMAKKDFWSIPLSNFTYMTVRAATALIVKSVVTSMLGDDNDEKTQKQIDELLDPQANLERFGASLVSLSMGGSSNLYGLALKAGMYVLDDAEVVNEEGKAKIYEWMQDDLYISGFQEYGSAKSILTSAVPGSSLIQDVFESGEAISAFMRATDKALDSGYITKEEYLKIANGINIAVMYGYPNALSGIVQKQMSPMIRAAVKENKVGTSGKEEEIDFTDQAQELLDQYEEFQKEELDFE